MPSGAEVPVPSLPTPAAAGGLATLRAAVILNAGSGTGGATDAQERIEQRFRDAGAEVDVTLAKDGDEIRRACAAALAAGVTRIVAGGGDGTANAVAQAVFGHDVTFGVLPLGTLNHFAKDVGLPLDLDEAIGVLLGDETLSVDIAEVNGQRFLNNSSLGLYPRLVELRQQHAARGIAKWIVAAWATLRVLRERPVLAVRVDVGGHQVVRRTPMVFIGNNPYQMQGLDAGARASITTGVLAIYIVRERRGLGLLQLVLRILFGTAHRSGQLEELRTTAALVETSGDALQVAVDGEVETLASPLHYRIHPGALRVLVPRRVEDEARNAES